MALQTKRVICIDNRLAAVWRHCGFYEYYQIGETDEDHAAESGSEDRPGELIRKGMHSPWGMLFEIIKQTGWTWHYVLWKVSRANLLLMIADQAYIKTKKEPKVKEGNGASLFQKIKSKHARD
jgi:hypothetical protein